MVCLSPNVKDKIAVKEVETVHLYFMYDNNKVPSEHRKSGETKGRFFFFCFFINFDKI